MSLGLEGDTVKRWYSWSGYQSVFLRELISNASDALDKLLLLSVTDNEILGVGGDLGIRIQGDKENGIIMITDSGIGMTRQELIDCLGTIAQSGTAKFLQTIKDNTDAGRDSNLIGQFGVGFYSAFLVAYRVVVSTKSPKSDKQYVWEAEANASSFLIREETDPEKLIPRGTRLTLFLKDEDKRFADPEWIQKLVKNYSQLVSFPIYTWQEKGYTKEVEVDEDLAEAKKDEQEQDGATEKKKKTKTVVERYWDVSNESICHVPITVAYSHFTTEGEVEFRSILYVPAVAPSGKDDIMSSKTENIRLYVKRLFISDDFDGELFPRYLSFVKGVVDSNDLPLNVSREILQESRIVRIMRKRLVRKAFEMILGICDYENFWQTFGKHIKLGCIEDPENHKRIAPLLWFFSSQSEEEMISLDEYVDNMKPEQKDIFYIAADSVASAKNAPFLEKLLEKDLEVCPFVLVNFTTCVHPGDASTMEFMRSRRVFEINPNHLIIKNLNAAYGSNPDDEDALKAIDLLYDTALVSSGFTPENPAELGVDQCGLDASRCEPLAELDHWCNVSLSRLRHHRYMSLGGVRFFSTVVDHLHDLDAYYKQHGIQGGGVHIEPVPSFVPVKFQCRLPMLVVTISMKCPPHRMGMVIGERGVSINFMREKTGCWMEKFNEDTFIVRASDKSATVVLRKLADGIAVLADRIGRSYPQRLVLPAHLMRTVPYVINTELSVRTVEQRFVELSMSGVPRMVKKATGMIVRQVVFAASKDRDSRFMAEFEGTGK